MTSADPQTVGKSISVLLATPGVARRDEMLPLFAECGVPGLLCGAESVQRIILDCLCAQDLKCLRASCRSGVVSTAAWRGSLGCVIEPEHLPAWRAAFPHARAVSVSPREVTRLGRALQHRTSSVRVTGTAVGAVSLVDAAPLERVTTLAITGRPPCVDYTALDRLDPDDCLAVMSSAAHLAGLPSLSRLRHLMLRACVWSAVGLLLPLTALEALYLEDCKVPAALDLTAQARTLTTLVARGTLLDERGSNFAPLRALRVVDVFESRIHVQYLTASAGTLQSLECHLCMPADASPCTVRDFHALISLRLHGASDAGDTRGDLPPEYVLDGLPPSCVELSFRFFSRDPHSAGTGGLDVRVLAHHLRCVRALDWHGTVPPALLAAFLQLPALCTLHAGVGYVRGGNRHPLQWDAPMERGQASSAGLTCAPPLNLTRLCLNLGDAGAPVHLDSARLGCVTHLWLGQGLLKDGDNPRTLGPSNMLKHTHAVRTLALCGGPMLHPARRLYLTDDMLHHLPHLRYLHLDGHTVIHATPQGLAGATGVVGCSITFKHQDTPCPVSAASLAAALLALPNLRYVLLRRARVNDISLEWALGVRRAVMVTPPFHNAPVLLQLETALTRHGFARGLTGAGGPCQDMWDWPYLVPLPHSVERSLGDTFFMRRV